MRTTVKIDDDAPAGLADQVTAADESLRVSFAGLPVEEIRPEVERSLDELGLDVPGDVVTRYAEHIAARTDFELDLR